MSKTIVVDSDAIFALYNPNDSLNAKAIKTFQELLDHDFHFVYPVSVMFEIISLFQRVLPTPLITTKLIEMITNDQLDLYPVDKEIVKEAALLFNPKGSKKNTIIDCSVAAIAKRIKAAGVFSYDEFYTKQGIKIAEEALKS